MRGLLAVALVGALAAVAAMPASAQTSRNTELAQASRQRVVVTPRSNYLPPHATRECQARLVQQNRASGPVIVPVTNCWWQY